MDGLVVFGAKYLFAIVVLGAFAPLPWMPREHRLPYLLSGLIAAIVAFAATKAAGAAYFDPRPFTHGAHALIAHEPDNGFPSDHTVLSFTAAVLSVQASKSVALALLIVALLVAACRVLAGVHEPLDVLAGAAFGVASAGFGMWGSRFYPPNQTPK